MSDARYTDIGHNTKTLDMVYINIMYHMYKHIVYDIITGKRLLSRLGNHCCHSK